MRPNTAETFWARVDRTTDDECWLWMGSLDIHGYGKVSWSGADRGTHRLAYELTVGQVPPGLAIDHLCRVRHCVNPAHLEPVTTAENNRRAALSRTHCRNGHEFTEANTYVHAGIRRRCRTCGRLNQARYAAAKKDETRSLRAA